MLFKKYSAFRAHHRAALQMYDTIVVVAKFIPLFQDWRFVRSTALDDGDQNKDEPVIASSLDLRFHGIAIKVM